MSVGEVIAFGGTPMPSVFPGRIGPVEAMSQALAAYLLAASFRVYGASDPRDSVFSLAQVTDHWPRPDEALNYPCASIIKMPGTDRDASMHPSPLEDTLGIFDNFIGITGGEPQTCLWVIGEETASFQVDFWLDKEADRQAVAGVIDDLFAPGEGNGSVIVEGPELYFGQECEFSLESAHPDDTADTAYHNERRLRCIVIGSCAIISLRLAVMTREPRVIVDIIDPVDPGEDEE